MSSLDSVLRLESLNPVLVMLLLRGEMEEKERRRVYWKRQRHRERLSGRQKGTKRFVEGRR